ncbi:hypothetical protein LEMLEM_LOCUS9161 [Lemmus lemmus]
MFYVYGCLPVCLTVYHVLCVWVFACLPDCTMFYVYRCLPVCLTVYHVFAVPMESRGGHQVPWNWSYRWWQTAMWVLGLLPASSGRAASALSF